jgi:16S rRNA (guanine1516-N2)-methyltransferase
VNKLYVINQELLAKANLLAVFTNQFVICEQMPEEEIFLRLDNVGLAIVSKQFQPLYIHNIYAKVYLRKKKIASELLIQAIKSKPDINTLIIDATAGLAKDALLLSLYGYKVIMLEQNPLLATVIYYAILEKLIPATNLQLFFINSLDYFKANLDIKPYAIYLDPMFNKAGKTLAKKDMQIIDLLAKDTKQSDDVELFNVSYSLCKKLIVKRDNKQQALVTKPLPTYSKQGKTIRYDIYVNE